MKKMSRFLSLFLVAIILFVTPVTASAVTTGVCGDNVSWVLDDGVLTISGTGPMYDFTSHQELPWGSMRHDIIIVVIEDGVTSIGDYAFSNFSNLISLNVPDSVTSFGDYAFYLCSSLGYVAVSENVTAIGDYVFTGCSNLYSVGFYGDIKRLGVSAFESCGNMEFITLPDSLTSIDDNAFYSCVSLEEIVIPDNVKSIGEAVFESCVSLKTAVFGKSVETIAPRVFYSCTNLKSVTIPAGIKHISDSVFVNNPKLKCVFFEGTEEEWLSLDIANYNDDLFKATMHYESSTHTPSKWITDKKATANAEGSKHTECTVCGEILETATIKQLKCGAVTLTKVTNVATGVKVYWSKVTGADSYRVYRKVKGGSYKVIGNTTKAYYTDTTAKSGTTYYYSVRAINEAGLGAVCKTTKSIKCLADPALKVPTSTRSGITLKWTKTTGASGYVIYRKAGNGSWKKLVTEKGVSNLSYVDKTAKKGTTYTYKIRAYYGSTYSAYSNTRQIKDKY